MVRIEGVKEVKAMLRRRKKKYGDAHVSVIVGYSQKYALFVHESIHMKLQGEPRKKPHKGQYWDPQGRAQPKFLEQPAREFRGVFVEIVRDAMEGGASLVQALLMAGLRLQRESQLLVPVDTGALKNSAFTRKE